MPDTAVVDDRAATGTLNARSLIRARNCDAVRHHMKVGYLPRIAPEE